MNDLNDPIFRQLAETYRQMNELYHGNVSDCMKQCKEVHPHLSTEECKKQYCEESMTTRGGIHESHTHEELMKLSDEKLAELKDEYTKKAADSEGEEKEKHEKELENIRSILDSRKTESKEEVSEAFGKLKKKVGRAIETIQGLVGLKVNPDTYRTPSGKKLDPLYYKRDLQKDGSNITKLITPAEKKKRAGWYHSGRQAGWPKEEGTQMEAKEILKAMKQISEKVAHKKRLAEESNEDHIAHHLSNAQNHWDHIEKGYTSDAVPHMKKAKALLGKATPEEQKRYNFIKDRLDRPHRESLDEDIGQAALADKVVSNAEKIKKLQKQAAPTHNVKKGK